MLSRNSCPCSPIHMQSMCSSSADTTVIGCPPDFNVTTSPGSKVMTSSMMNGRRWYDQEMTDRSRPFHHRRHRRQDRVNVAAGFQPEHGAAVVEQVELDITAAADQLLFALALAPRRDKIAPHQLGIDSQERFPHRLREGEVGFPVAGVEPVVKDAADAAHLAAVLE